ncbi:MAG: glycogen/starch synthase [Candidatus Faecousia sp.]|nr:glycogen/starch synthase [Bacillota bacterium]MDY6040632.1 glycogen/starch synthase [Candidatus Faecousia sp.]
MRIAVCASEGAPYVKSGGLGDVIEALPAALAQIAGNEVALFLPYYKKIKEAGDKYPVELVSQYRVMLGWRQQYAGLMRLTNRTDGVQVYFIDNEYYFGARPGAIYGDIDDGERFAYFSRACLDAMLSIGYIPDVIQCNDWQTALVPVYLKAMYRGAMPNTRCMYTIHNIEYQGWANASFFDDVLGLPWEYRGTLDMNGSVNVMKGAIETADLVTTVSETYARELMYPYYAHGLDGILAGAAWKLTGITNGIDVGTFNPETDSALPAHYNADSFVEGKAACKAALQKEVGLPVKPDVPLMVMVTRLAGHKGLDLLCYIARRLLWEEDCQLLILGTGEPQYENFFRNLANEYPEQCAAKITFNLGLAARIYAGGDIYLMPSKSEPCGLSQMNAMRYGTVPVVHATGGLKDTVPPADENGEGGLGFTFQSYNADDFLASVKRCLNLYHHNRDGFRALQHRDMCQDFSWNVPAGRYMDLFYRMLSW